MMDDAFELEEVDLTRKAGVEEIRAFLARFDLGFDRDEVERTLALRASDGTLVGTGSCGGEVLRNVAVDDSHQGEGLTAMILSALMRDMAQRGILHYFIFTKPSKADMFASLGFREIARAEPFAALLESGIGSAISYCDSVARQAGRLPPRRAAIVMNANPFTKGHQALVRRAAAENDAVLIFVVEEDRSAVPFPDRLAMVRAGTADLKNVRVVLGGKYIISAATFPTYFTHGEDQVLAQTRLDATLFATRIAPRLGIATRYVGEEPYCRTTAAYNQALLDILPKAHIAVNLVPRLTADGEAGGEVISASTVRELIVKNDWHRLAYFLPETTLAYLRDPEHAAVLDKIRAAAPVSASASSLAPSPASPVRRAEPERPERPGRPASLASFEATPRGYGRPVRAEARPYAA